ncbi:hypothetical protein HDU80_006441 [Chytriomyces hyalinus]|nr:hypothetical protein HDU80_006441 [Chytriomyces hyalinus]
MRTPELAPVSASPNSSAISSPATTLRETSNNNPAATPALPQQATFRTTTTLPTHSHQLQLMKSQDAAMIQLQAAQLLMMQTQIAQMQAAMEAMQDTIMRLTQNQEKMALQFRSESQSSIFVLPPPNVNVAPPPANQLTPPPPPPPPTATSTSTSRSSTVSTPTNQQQQQQQPQPRSVKRKALQAEELMSSLLF